MITYLFAVIFSLAFVLFPHRPGIFGFIMASVFFISMFIPHEWKDVVLATVASVWLISISTNVFMQHKPFLYLDKTKSVDRVLGNGKWIFLAVTLAIAILIRAFN
jgi:hypothetical protein